MSTPTEYRLLKERHEALVAALGALADEWEHPAEVYALRKSAAPRLRALLEGDTR